MRFNIVLVSIMLGIMGCAAFITPSMPIEEAKTCSSTCKSKGGAEAVKTYIGIELRRRAVCKCNDGATYYDDSNWTGSHNSDWLPSSLKEE